MVEILLDVMFWSSSVRRERARCSFVASKANLRALAVFFSVRIRWRSAFSGDLRGERGLVGKRQGLGSEEEVLSLSESAEVVGPDLESSESSFAW